MGIVVRGGTLIDGTGAEPSPADLLIADDRIRSVDTRIEPRRDDTVIEAGGLTVLPGLIDAHSHLGLVELKGAGATPVAMIAAQIFRNCELAVEGGFTTVRDCGGVDGGLGRAIDVGLVLGPRLFPSGPILCQTGGHGDFTPPFAAHPH